MKVGDKEKYAERCIQVDINDLQGEFVRLPSDLHYWRQEWVTAVGHEAEATGLRKAAAGAIKDAYATTYQRLKQLKADGAQKALSEAAIAEAIQLDPEYQEAIKAERYQAAHEANMALATARASAMVEAIQAKKEMIISLGAHVRAERDAGIRDRAG